MYTYIYINIHKYKATQASGNMRKRDVCMGKAGALENLSLEDVGVLEELEEEYARRGSYRRIFPQVLLY